MKKCFFLYLVLSFLTNNSYAQVQGQAQLDLLFKELPKATTDTGRIRSWTAIAREYANINPDSGIYYGNLSLAKSQEINWTHGEIGALSSLGALFQRKGVFDKALDYYNRSVNLCKEPGDSVELAISLNGMANIYVRIGDNNKALKYVNRALMINEALDNKSAISVNYNLLGIIAIGLEKYSEALIYYDKALKAAQEVNYQQIIAYAYSNSGIAYQGLNQYDKALEYHFKALVIEDEMGDIYGLATEYGSISDAYMGLFRQQNNKQNTMLMDSAIKYSQLGINLAIKCDNPLDRATMTFSLSEIYKLKKDFPKALELYTDASKLKDSIFSADNQKQIREVEALQQEKIHEKERKIQDLEIQRQKLFRNSSLAGIAGLILFSIVVVRQRNKVKKEKARSEELLLNILPSEVAEELKATGATTAKDFSEVTVLFTDFKNFTSMSENLTAQELVNEINYCYSAFDNIITKHGIEKIKTIGDSYMCAGGLPVANHTNAEATVRVALEIRDFMIAEQQKRSAVNKPFFEIRIGCHTGPVVAGIVGIKKFAYDIWGDTVNIASRMESSGEAGKVNISNSTFELVKDKFKCMHRGKIEAKNKGVVDMYFVENVNV